MKTVAKVFGILGIIGSAIGMVLCVILGLAVMTGAIDLAQILPPDQVAELGDAIKIMGGVYLFMGFAMIVPLVINILFVKKLGTATSKNQLLVWAILEIVLGSSLLAGIFALLIKDEDLL